MTWVADARAVANKVIESLPAGLLFLFLVHTSIIFVMFISMALMVHDLANARIEAVVRLFDMCTRALSK